MYKPIRRAELIKGGYTIKQGEIFTLGFQLFDADGILITPSNQTVSVKIANRTGVIYDTEAEIVGDHIEFTVNENIGYGKMRVELKVSEGETIIQKYPADGWIELNITASLDDVSVGNVYAVTAEQMHEDIRDFQKQIDTLVIEGDSSVEAAQARINSSGVVYSTLKARLDGENNSVNTAVGLKSDKTYVDTKIASVVSGAPSGTYATVAALQTAFPTGNTKIYVVSADGKWYYWNTSAWTAGGVYQSTGLLDGGTTPDKIDTYLSDSIGNLGLKLTYGKNLFNKDKVTLDTLINSSGVLTANLNWSTSDFIEVDPNVEHHFNTVRYKLEFDKFKRPIAGTFLDNPSGQVTFTTNAKTKYVRYNVPTSNLGIAQLEKGSVTTLYQKFVSPKLVKQDGTALTIENVENANLNFEIKPNKNLFDKNAVTLSTSLNVNEGTTVADSNYMTSGFIEVTKNSSVTVSNPRFILEYDKNKNYLSSYYDVSTQIKTTFVTTANTKFIKVALPNEKMSVLQVEYGIDSTGYEAFYTSAYYGGVKVFDLREGVATMANVDLLKLADYTRYVDRDKYQIWKYSGSKKVVSILKDVAVRTNGVVIGTTIEISTTGLDGSYSNSVVFNSTNFPNLIANSGIEQIVLVPWTRNPTSERTAKQWRMVVITTFGQLYHNFPSRAVGTDGTEVAGDIIKFDESVVWDLPERKYPSLNVSATGTERYMPGLPVERYNYYPAVNAVTGYNNGGFDKSITKNYITYPRFYQPGRTSQTNSFGFMGGFEPDNKIQVIGTYKSNSSEAVRICLFASDDGGRSWYNKYEFTTLDSLPATKIDTSAIVENYVANSFTFTDRTLNPPSEVDKEPVNVFIWKAPVVVASITKGASTVITTSTPHGLRGGGVIAFKTNTGASAGWDWLLNNGVSATSGGNGVLFGVKILTSTTFELYEYVSSSFNSLRCRHIHYVNRVKDGWIFGTGEEYPNGFIFYMQMIEADTFRNKLAHEDFKIVRLSSTAGAVQRLIGADLQDDPNSTMIVAVDNETTPRNNVIMPAGRTDTFYRSSTGIFKGKLADIDDMDAYTSIFEGKDVAYFFKKKGGAYVYGGQYGEFAISFDDGETWLTEDLREKIEHFLGESKKYIVIDNFIIILKQ